MTFGFDVLCTTVSSMFPYIFGHFACLTTHRISAIGDITYEMNWFECPMEIQRRVLLMIERSQEPIHFSGFNLMRCTLEALAKVWNSLKICFSVFQVKNQMEIFS